MDNSTNGLSRRPWASLKMKRPLYHTVSGAATVHMTMAEIDRDENNEHILYDDVNLMEGRGLKKCVQVFFSSSLGAKKIHETIMTARMILP
jgi:hypothetical protein